MLGDTAIELAMGAAEMAYSVHLFSPTSERVRNAVVKAIFEIIQDHYQKKITWDEYWAVVTERIKELQEKDRSERLLMQPETPGPHYDERSIDDLFDENRQDPSPMTMLSVEPS